MWCEASDALFMASIGLKYTYVADVKTAALNLWSLWIKMHIICNGVTLAAYDWWLMWLQGHTC